MKGLLSVYKKELYLFFASPIFWVISFIFLGLTGYFFYSAVAYYSLLSFQAAQNPMLSGQLNMTEFVLKPLFGDISVIMLLLMPILTMRLMSEEKKAGTIELLFTYPLKDSEIIWGKYLAALTVFFLMLLGTLSYMLILAIIGKPEGGPIFTGYLGLALMGAAFIAFGLFASSLTENQIVAAVISFGALLMFWVISWIRSIVGPLTGQIFSYLSIIEHYENFAKGIIDSRDLIYYLLFISFFYFLTARFLETKHWRG